MDITLKLKSIQYHNDVTVNNIHVPFITHFLDKANVKYINQDNKITVPLDFKEKLYNYFKNIDLEQLSFDFNSLTHGNHL